MTRPSTNWRMLSWRKKKKRRTSRRLRRGDAVGAAPVEVADEIVRNRLSRTHQTPRSTEISAAVRKTLFLARSQQRTTASMRPEVKLSSPMVAMSVVDATGAGDVKRSERTRRPSTRSQLRRRAELSGMPTTTTIMKTRRRSEPREQGDPRSVAALGEQQPAVPRSRLKLLRREKTRTLATHGRALKMQWRTLRSHRGVDGRHGATLAPINGHNATSGTTIRRRVKPSNL